MVSLLDMERDFEIDSLNSDYEHRLNIRSLDQELEFAKLTRCLLYTSDAADE